MNMMKRKSVLLLTTAIIVTIFAAAAAAAPLKSRPLMIEEQGSFAAGGSIVSSPGKLAPYKWNGDGPTLHGDHASVFYQIPVKARKLPLVFLHGAGQSGRTWETTPDGREGFQDIFLRRGFGIYLLDQPRRGSAGRSTVPMEVKAIPDEQLLFGIFRLGTWPDFCPNVQFSRNPRALEQFFRQATPNTGPYDAGVVSDAVSAVFDRIGEGVLVTHSQGGGPGWYSVMKNNKIRAVAAYEPGSDFIFPQGEEPAPMPSSAGTLKAVGVPLADFMKLTKIPIIVYYGDNIPGEPTDNPGQDNWRVRLAMARLWAKAVNEKGGDVTLVHLPEIGIRGNTHFPFSDLNNIEIADLLSKFLKEKGLDK